MERRYWLDLEVYPDGIETEEAFGYDLWTVSVIHFYRVFSAILELFSSFYMYAYMYVKRKLD